MFMGKNQSFAAPRNRFDSDEEDDEDTIAQMIFPRKEQIVGEEDVKVLVSG